MTTKNHNFSFLWESDLFEVGYTEEAQTTAESYNRYKTWVAEGEDGPGPLTYLTGERALIRENLKYFFPKFQSALVFLFPYSPTLSENNAVVIADYVLGFGGEDYHIALRRYLEEIKRKLSEVMPKEFEAVYTLDIHPALERDLAHRAGLGWFGKNSMLINMKHGSYFMIGSLLLSHKLPIEVAQKLRRPLVQDHCGNCRACLDVCPTKAINNNRTIKASRCISTFTIEMFKDGVLPLPEGFTIKEKEIFGCDRCQQVCPWNRRLLINKQEARGALFDKISNFFYTRPPHVIYYELLEWSNRYYRTYFAGTALARTGRLGMIKNLKRLLTK